MCADRRLQRYICRLECVIEEERDGELRSHNDLRHSVPALGRVNVSFEIWEYAENVSYVSKPLLTQLVSSYLKYCRLGML